MVDRGAAAAPEGLNSWSRHVTQPKSQGASQAMLYATGLREEDMGKAQVQTCRQLITPFTSRWLQLTSVAAKAGAAAVVY